MIPKVFNTYRVILASQSPRRKELLEKLGFKFSLAKIEVQEIYPKGLRPTEIPAYLSKLKAEAYRAQLKEGDLLITADTIVSINHQVLGKPRNETEATTMLQQLSGQEHEVITAVSLTTLQKQITETDIAKVSFGKISSEEIAFYIKNYQPFDKAGAYGIQEWIGLAKIDKIKGSYYTIMGLPTHLLYKMLEDLI